MVSLVIISTIDLDDWMPGSRAPGLFVFAPLNSREKERGQGVGTFFRLDNATLRNFSFTQKRADRGSSLNKFSPAAPNTFSNCQLSHLKVFQEQSVGMFA